MKRQFTFLKVSLVGLFLTVTGTGWAQPYYNYYTCPGSSINLVGNLNGATPYAEYLWVVNDGTSDIDTHSELNEETYPYTVPSTPGAYTITLRVRDENGCFSDAQTSTLYVLPTFTVAISANRDNYCTEDGAGSELTADATPAVTLPDGVNFQYDWESNGSVVATDTNPYIMNTSAVGSYSIVAKGKYVLDAANSGELLSDCETSSAAQTITVNDLPGTPTITISAN